MSAALVAVVSFLLAVWAHARAAQENRVRRPGRVWVFDAWRAGGVVASGWVFGSVLALCEPYLRPHVGGQWPLPWPVSLEVSVLIGVASFAWYAWERRHGWHTWQRYPRTGAVCS